MTREQRWKILVHAIGACEDGDPTCCNGLCDDVAREAMAEADREFEAVRRAVQLAQHELSHAAQSLDLAAIWARGPAEDAS